MEDKQIVALYLQRNEQALAETAAKYGKYCFSIANNILGNAADAEEAVNDAYLGVWAAIPPHRPVTLSTFVGKITRRTAIKRWQMNHARKRGGGEMEMALEELSECIPAKNTVESAVETARLNKVLNQFVLTLPSIQRQVFLCRYWYLDSIDAIAQRFGYSQSKVKSMLSRTRKKLYARLLKEEIDL